LQRTIEKQYRAESALEKSTNESISNGPSNKQQIKDIKIKFISYLPEERQK